MSPRTSASLHAVKEFARIHTTGVLAHLLLRTADWVPNVRDRAVEAFTSAMDTPPLDQIVPLAPLVTHVALGGWVQRQWTYGPDRLVRVDTSVVDNFMGRLDHRAGREALLESMAAPDASQTRAAYRLLSATVPADPEVIAAALRSRDGLVQQWAVAAHLTGDATIDILERALASPFPSVRKAALQGVVDHAPPSAPEYIRAALFDRSESVRAVARYHGPASDIDPLTLYRESAQHTNARVDTHSRTRGYRSARPRLVHGGGLCPRQTPCCPSRRRRSSSPRGSRRRPRDRPCIAQRRRQGRLDSRTPRTACIAVYRRVARHCTPRPAPPCRPQRARAGAAD